MYILNMSVWLKIYLKIVKDFRNIKKIGKERKS